MAVLLYYHQCKEPGMSKLLIACAAIACLVSAQNFSPDQHGNLPRDIRDLIDQAPAAPPELAADILLRLVEARKVPDKKIKTAILEQAFVLAGSAHHSLKLTVGTANIFTDSDVGVVIMAHENKLDALSLRCRVIRLMLEIDPKRALEL